GQLDPWLTTDQARVELVEEILSKHRGSSAGIQPSVKIFRETAKLWKTMIAAADKAHNDLAGDDGHWQGLFLEKLCNYKVRTEARVSEALEEIVSLRRQREEEEAERLRLEAAERDKEAERLAAEQARLASGT